MDEARLSLAREWLRKASHDLVAARRLAEGPHPVLDAAAYHCQQTAEKAIKGLLVLYDCPFEKTHDVRLLVTQAADVCDAATCLLDDADLLTPYATAYRYPSELVEPTDEELAEALRAASRVFEQVLVAAPALTPEGA